MKERGVLHGVKMLARLCQANASAITSSVTELMKSGAKVSRSAIALFRLPRRAEAVTRAALRPCDGTIIGQIHGTPAQQRRTQKQDEDDVLHCVVRGGSTPSGHVLPLGHPIEQAFERSVRSQTDQLSTNYVIRA